MKPTSGVLSMPSSHKVKKNQKPENELRTNTRMTHISFRVLQLCLVCMLICGGFVATSAQQQQQRSTYKILGVEVEGNTFVDAGSILTIAGLKPGDELVSGTDKLQTAIKNLWKRKQFSRVDITVDKVTALGLFLKIKIKEFPRLNEILPIGNSKLNNDEVRKAVGKFRGDILSNYDIYLAKFYLKKAYSKEGMPFAKIEATTKPSDTAGYVRLIITIKEGSDFYAKSIEFTGNTQVPSDDLAGSFDDTHTKKWWQFWRSAKFDKEKYDKDKKNIVSLYKKRGYIDAELVKDSVRYDEANEAVNIAIQVNEGKKYFVRNVTFEGNTVFPMEIMQHRLSVYKGDVYDVERFDKNLNGNDDQTDVASLYLNSGYLAARVEKEEKRVSGTDSIDIGIRVVERNQFTIRRIDIEGNSKTMDKVIRRELFTRPGDFFNRAAIINSVRALGVLNYFNPEGLRPDVKMVDNNRVDVLYKVEEKSSDTFNASVGFAGTLGLTGSIGITLNNFSLSQPLQGGAGQQFNFSWEFGTSSQLQTFTLGFTEPWLFDEPTTVGASIYDTHYTLGYDLRRTGAQVNLGRRFHIPDDYFRGDWSVRIQRNIVNDNGANTYKTGVTTEITLFQTFSRISLDNAVFPTDGSRFSLSNQFAMGALGIGNTDYLKSGINFELYNPLLKVGDANRLVLYLSSQLGYNTGLKNDSTIPPVELYFMGGNGLGGFSVTPLRGYLDRVIGPRDVNGSINGGRVIARYLAELRFAISMNPVPIYVLGFAEAGNVWESLSKTDPFDLKRSAGLGLRLMLNPIGLIGFDYGYGFDPVLERGDKSGWQFHFQFGR